MESTTPGAGEAGDHGDGLGKLGPFEAWQVDPLDPGLSLGLASQPVSGWRRWNSSVRNVATTISRSSRALRVRRRAGRESSGPPSVVLHDEQDQGGLAQAAEEPQDALEDTDLQPVGVAGRHGYYATDARQLWNKPRELGEAGAAASAMRARSTSWTSARSASTSGPKEARRHRGRQSPLEHEPVAGSRRSPARRRAGSCRRPPRHRRGPARLCRTPRRRPHRGVWATPWSDRRRPGTEARSCRQ